MKNFKVVSPLKAEVCVDLPASKSISNRALILNALSGGGGRLRNVAKCDDTDAMVTALANDSGTVNVGAAGTAMRFLTAFFATRQGQTTIIDGSERMRQRPIKILVDALRSCGAKIEYLVTEGFPPLRITGTELSASEVSIPGNVSSQYISAILMISPLIKGCRKITLTEEIISAPYIAMTISLMRQFGVGATMVGNEVIIPEGARYRTTDFVIENDWSAASYWFEIASLLPQSSISLKGLLPDSLQGDSFVTSLFEPFGISASWEGPLLRLQHKAPSSDKITMDLLQNPDLAQTIIVTACLANRHFHITGLQTLKIKETDRIEALRTQLLKLGYVISVGDDWSLSWNGETTQPHSQPAIATFKDHRMAMAFAPAALLFPNIIIEDAMVISKSYPDYWQHLTDAGYKIEEL